ncbi:AbrB/MazE/SpoVT family DNA-binding domain-containing protein [uncultured Enterovirga sp.]|uniref:AbrB/MazE/SpoVT family DNA-binding domain-containing protein n=1 Tax=uncultured Enterovirga sp. TaxID=2026352 RepID=UPI0035C9DC9F
MATRVTVKGQVTIPKAVRESLGIRPGDEVEFYTGHDGAVELRRSDLLRRFEETLADLRRDPPIKGITTDEIMRMTRGDDR